MRKITLVILLLFISNITLAQNMSNKPDNDSGLYIGGSLMGTSWTIGDVSNGVEAGGGLGLELGYNINTNFALFGSLDGSVINPGQGDEYALAHVDIGAEGRIGDASNKFRPFGRVSYLGMSAQSNEPSGNFETNGSGFGLGIGAYYFATNNVAFDIGYTHSWVQLNETKINGTSYDFNEQAQSGRFDIGISYHF